ncbi:MAG: fumarylacetoacetate hydrolase family protein [Anaerolineae bacterium]|nr:fumarylacetoacetate hydrolase family protein [Anaerolineae bacterium]
MIFLTYREGHTLKLGLKTTAGVVDVHAAASACRLDLPATPDAFYGAGSDTLPKFQALMECELIEYTQPEADLTLAPVVPNPGKIICVGLNYRKHAAESNMAAPTIPILFSKFNNTLAANGEDVPITKYLTQVDYEAELGVVIGKTAKDVSEAEALDYVLGYCNANDLSDRAAQFMTSQWLPGKTPDKFLPLGPYLVTADEAGDPQAMPVNGWFNGELRQNSSTSDMVFSVAQIISFASRYMTLEPGDIISTGTPEGVIFGMKEKVWMKPGDEYVIEIGNLGRLTNRMVVG